MAPSRSGPGGPPGWGGRQKPVYYPGISKTEGGGGGEEGMPHTMRRPDPPPPVAVTPQMREAARAFCHLLFEEGCADGFYERFRAMLRVTTGKGQDPSFHKPPLAGIPIVDTRATEVALAAGGAFTDLISWTVPQGFRCVVTHLGADVLPVGLDEENLVRFRVLHNGSPERAGIPGSTGGVGYDGFSEWMGTVADPQVLTPAILLRERERFAFQGRNIDAVSAIDIRPHVRGWFFSSADPAREGLGGWTVD
jgi:hypothetical protein